MTAYHFSAGRKEEVKALVLEHHYSRKVPGVGLHFMSMHFDGGLFGDTGRIAASCIVGLPGNAKWKEPLYELQRLVRHPDAKDLSLSGFMSMCMKHLKRKRVDLIISYADISKDHHGGIYQACSWEYNGMSPPITKFIIFGEELGFRSCSSKFGTASVDQLRKIVGDENLVVKKDRGKFLYWKALGNEGKKKAERLGLKSLPYEKPNNT